MTRNSNINVLYKINLWFYAVAHLAWKKGVCRWR